MRKTNDAGIDLIKSFEGLELDAYQDSGGVWTIGYGHTGGVKPGQHITEEEAEELFREDLGKFETMVEAGVSVLLNDNQFAALVSFAFNVGPGKKGVKDGFLTLKSGQPPTLRRVLNQGDYARAADELLKWNHAAGGTPAGLTRRRKAERKLFLTPDGVEPSVATSTETVTTTTTEAPGTLVEKTSSIVSSITGNAAVKQVASEGVTKLATRATTALATTSTATATGGVTTGKTWLIVLSVVLALGAIAVILFLLWHKSSKEKEAARINSDRTRDDIEFKKR